MILTILLGIFLLILNFGISWWNAYVTGRCWAESKKIGGWLHLIVWCAAIMSTIGFTWCYLIILAVLAGSTGILSPEYVQGAIELGYLIIIFPTLGTGLVIWIHSLIEAWKKKTLINTGVAAWNTFAQIHNTYSAIKTIPPALQHLKSLGNMKGDGKNKAAMFMLLVVVIAIISGILTTVLVARWTMKKYSHEALAKIKKRKLR